MSTENQALQSVELKVEVKQPIVKTAISAELTRQFGNLQNLISEAAKIQFTKDNLETEGAALVTISQALKQINAVRERIKKPYFDACTAIDAAAREIAEPLNNILYEKTDMFKRVAREIHEERERAAMENYRIAGIKEKINDFILDASQKIASSNTAGAIERVEKRIAEEKKKTETYQEFLPELVKRIEELAPLIKNQKQAIRKG